MAQLEYSVDALNVLNKFYRAQVLAYVEGDDDIPFWNAIFSGIPGCTVAVESAGGCAEIEKFIFRIESDRARILVARDADYTGLKDERSGSKQVIYSYGHSIENSLYVASAIVKISQWAHRKVAPREEDVVAWLDELSRALRPVVINDIASDIDELGVVALSDNCGSFMVNKSSPLTSDAKISARLAQIEAKIPEASRERAARIVEQKGGYSGLLLRGHVLASAVLRFVREHSGRNVANETIFTNAIAVFEQHFVKGHPHSAYYRQAVTDALDSLSAA